MDHAALQVFDSFLQSAPVLTNCDLSDLQWLQPSLPIRHGGIGLRRVSLLTLPAFLSSAVSTSLIQDAILSAFPCSADSHFESYLAVLQSRFIYFFDSLQFPAKQCLGDGPDIKADYSHLESSANLSAS